MLGLTSFPLLWHRKGFCCWAPCLCSRNCLPSLCSYLNDSLLKGGSWCWWKARIVCSTLWVEAFIRFLLKGLLSPLPSLRVNYQICNKACFISSMLSGVRFHWKNWGMYSSFLRITKNSSWLTYSYSINTLCISFFLFARASWIEWAVRFDFTSFWLSFPERISIICCDYCFSFLFRASSYSLASMLFSLFICLDFVEISGLNVQFASLLPSSYFRSITLLS